MNVCNVEKINTNLEETTTDDAYCRQFKGLSIVCVYGYRFLIVHILNYDILYIYL
jgi:hypothetical protein